MSGDQLTQRGGVRLLSGEEDLGKRYFSEGPAEAHVADHDPPAEVGASRSTHRFDVGARGSVVALHRMCERPCGARLECRESIERRETIGRYSERTVIRGDRYRQVASPQRDRPIEHGDGSAIRALLRSALDAQDELCRADEVPESELISRAAEESIEPGVASIAPGHPEGESSEEGDRQSADETGKKKEKPSRANENPDEPEEPRSARIACAAPFELLCERIDLCCGAPLRAHLGTTHAAWPITMAPSRVDVGVGCQPRSKRAWRSSSAVGS
jgi:hypothetical protein